MKKIKTKILIRYFLFILISAVLWVFLTLLFASSAIYWLNEIKYQFFGGTAYSNNVYLLVYFLFSAAVYLVFLLIGTAIFLSRTAGFLDKSYDAFSGVLEDDYKTPDLPRVIKPVHAKTENSIKNALKYREYLAQEAEQRKNDLVVYLAHDLKTPLTSVIGYLTLLQESPEMPIEHRAKYTSIALEKAYRLETLINEFFDITRFNLQSIALENNHIDLTMMINQIAEEFYPLLKEKGLTCNVSVQNRIKIVGDADKLSRVFDNLMRNAVSYSYPDSQITISAHTENGRAVISFKNRGDKIPEQKLRMIFEKFFRADNARASTTGGAGLGLAIAKQIIELHGGTITAKSDDYFTTFTVMLNL